MNNLNIVLISSFILIFQTAIFGQWQDYNFQRPIENVTETWHDLELPVEIYEKIGPEKQDLRIFGLSESGDTLEVPYILRRNESTSKLVPIPFEKINETQNGNGYFVTLELTESQKIDEIELNFDQNNFDWKVTLEGSHDQQEWFQILEDYRIVSIDNELTYYNFTKLNFPPAQYSFFRLKVPNREKPKLVNAQIFRKEKSDEKIQQFDNFNIKTIEEKKAKRTKLSIFFEQAVPLSMINFSINADYDFYRDFTLEYLRDSISTPKGMKYQYGVLKHGKLSSLEKNEFEFPNIVTTALRVLIKNQDNSPLTIERPIISGNIHSLIVRFPNQTNPYFFAYGNEEALKPNYDLVNFQNKIPDTLALLSLRKETQIAQKELMEASPLFQNKWWLWGVMVLMIGLLGWFTFKMMK